jgi:hypothetical protein
MINFTAIQQLLPDSVSCKRTLRTQIIHLSYTSTILQNSLGILLQSQVNASVKKAVVGKSYYEVAL